MPTDQIPIGNGQMIFQWKMSQTVSRPGVATPIGGMIVYAPPRTDYQQCIVSLTASTVNPHPTLNDWIIQSYQWNGQC
jgi:hypothetical protein